MGPLKQNYWMSMKKSQVCIRVPVWQPALTKGKSEQIEKVQRTAFYIILGKEYENYDNDLILLERETLEARRIKLCKKFARKALKNPRYANWFYPANKESSPNIKTRGHKRTASNLKPVHARTVRFEKSPIPYMTKILNSVQLRI